MNGLMITIPLSFYNHLVSCEEKIAAIKRLYAETCYVNDDTIKAVLEIDEKGEKENA